MDSGPCGPPPGTSIYLNRGEAEFEFQVPISLEYNIDTLKLAVTGDEGGFWQIPRFELFEWSSQTWLEISELKQGTNLIRDGDRFVSDDGVIRLRMSNSPDNVSTGGGCTYLGFGIEASRSTAEP